MIPGWILARNAVIDPINLQGTASKKPVKSPQPGVRGLNFAAWVLRISLQDNLRDERPPYFVSQRNPCHDF